MLATQTHYSSQNSKFFQNSELFVRACKLVGKCIYNYANFHGLCMKKTKKKKKINENVHINSFCNSGINNLCM